MVIDTTTLEDAASVLALLRARGMRIATAESCTGGLIAGALTHVPGSSDVVECGFVTYSNAAKSRMLGVPPALIGAHGAVSQPVAASMAEGAASRAGVEIAIAVTGVAGPGGGSADKPVGLVWFGCALAGQPAVTDRVVFPGDRTAVRAATVAHALRLVRRLAASWGDGRSEGAPPHD